MTNRILLAAIAAAVLAPAASAHVTANPAEAPAGGFTMISFRVPHGCEESATTRLSIQIPEGVVSVAPEAVPGWEVETVEGPYDEPVQLHGEEVTEGVKEVTWTGGPLDAHQFLDFGLSMRMPEAEGETIYFPVVQTCEQGETSWITIPVAGEEEPDTPAPGVTLLAASGGHGSSTGSAGSDDSTSSAAQEPATEAAAAVEDDEDDDTMAMAALVLGGLGLVAGLGALGLTWRRGRAA
jgi:uncharacterized protein YcnI